MKFSFNLKEKQASFEADVEKLIEKKMAHPASATPRKTRYQIKQEEKRKNEELKQKHFFQGIIMLLLVVVFFLVICGICSFLGL